MRRILIGVLVAVVAGVLATPTSAGAASAQSTTMEFLVLYKAGASPAAARAAITAAGGTVVGRPPPSAWPPCGPGRPVKQSAARQTPLPGADNRPSVSLPGLQRQGQAGRGRDRGRDARGGAAASRGRADRLPLPACIGTGPIDATHGSYKVERGELARARGIRTGVDCAHPTRPELL